MQENHNTVPGIASLPNETWKEVVGYNGLYLVSDLGRIASRAYGYWRVKKLTALPRGVQHVKLYLNGLPATRKVHRLVLEAFCGPCPPKKEGCHRNGNASDNRLINLYWGTKSQNQRDKRKHGTAGTLTPNDIREIRQAASDGVMYKTLAARFEVNPSHISKIVSGKKWRGLQ